MENLVITFSTDTTGIETASHTVGQFSGADKSLTEQSSKTNAVLKERAALLLSLKEHVLKHQ
jgi:hypothetical protein